MNVILYESCHWLIAISFGAWGLPFGLDIDKRNGHMLAILCLQIIYIPYGTYNVEEVKK